MDRKRKTKKINLLDLFSGIGGFSLGLQQAGIKIGWHGYSEIDKYANKLFKRRFEDAEQLGSITDVSYESLGGKRLDLLTGGFPCQAFSIAGRRRGFDDTRGTLFFEIARILKDYIKNGHPIPCILLENVKGLLSHDSRRTFTTIYKVLADLNYTLECQVVNTRWFLPQNRERIFIFGRYNGNPSGRKVFPIGKNDIKINYGEIDIVGHSGTGGQRGDIHSPNGIASCLSATDYKQPQQVLNQIGFIEKNSQGSRVYDSNGVSKTISDGGGMGAKTGLCKVHNLQPRTPNRPSLKTQSGGSGALSKKDGTTYCLEPHNLQAVEYNYGQKALNETLEQNELAPDDIKALDLYNRKAQDVSPTLTEPHHNSLRLYEKSKIRRLTPIECERLQGFPDGWTDGQSDTQRYKQCGNAVSVPVIKAIIEKIYG